METELRVNLDTALCRRFEMALQLNGESKENVVAALIKSYVVRVFAQEAAQYEDTTPSSTGQATDGLYGKALHRIPKWAKKTTQINHKIIRAYLQLAEKGVVTYNMLADYCGDRNNADVYVATFNSNFAQMKFDGEKSHGKVFEVNESGVITIWNHVASCLEEYKKYFLFHSTDVGYVNEFSQKNMGKTEMKGTGYLQHLYAMRCEKCGYEYHANGHDIFLKRCPNCQGGADTGK